MNFALGMLAGTCLTTAIFYVAQGYAIKGLDLLAYGGEGFPPGDLFRRDHICKQRTETFAQEIQEQPVDRNAA